MSKKHSKRTKKIKEYARLWWKEKRAKMLKKGLIQKRKPSNKKGVKFRYYWGKPFRRR